MTGVDVVVIGSGAPRYAAAFREKLGCEFPVYSDEALRVFKGLSFGRSYKGLLKAAMWKRGFQAVKGGFRQGKVQGDAQQLGGMLGVTPEKEVFFYYASEFAGDHPSLEDALAGLPASKG